MALDLKSLISQAKGKRSVHVKAHERTEPTGKKSLVDEYIKYIDLNAPDEEMSKNVDKMDPEDTIDMDVEHMELPDPDDEDLDEETPEKDMSFTVLEQAQLPKIDVSEINGLIINWQKRRDEDSMRQLVDHFSNLIYFFANKYKTGSIPYKLIVLRGKALLVKAADTYNPTKGAKFNTHLTNYLKKLYRFTNDNANIAKIPEQRVRKISNYRMAYATLEERLGRPPTEIELADELSWPVKEVHRLVEEDKRKEILNFGEEYSYGDLGVKSSKMFNIINLVYHDASPEEQYIIEHTTNLVNKKQMSTEELAKKLKLPESKVKYMLSIIKKRIMESL